MSSRPFLIRTAAAVGGLSLDDASLGAPGGSGGGGGDGHTVDVTSTGAGAERPLREGRGGFWYRRPGGPALTAVSPDRGDVDRDAFDRFRRGEEQAFLAIHDAHAAVIARLVGRFFPRPFEREEAAQEVWLLVHRMAGAFDPARGSLVAWLRVLAANRCRELLRALGRRLDAREELSEHEDPGDAANPESVVRLARLREAVARFSVGLSAEETLVLKLSLLEERSLEEVAAAVGASVRRCKYLRKKLLARAVADPRLRAAVEEVAGT
jgi:RNA polymerase sigma-70 factor (ECF subfamily)